MNELLKRPEPNFGAGAGLFRHEHFQVAYATTDMDRALQIFGERFGVREFRRLEGPLAQGGQIRMEIGWAGGVMYELLWAQGPGSDVFRAGLPDQGFAIVPHHLGYRVSTPEDWEVLRQEIEAKGLKILHKTDAPGFLKAVIVEDPDLGHFLEYILPEAGGVEFFETSPSN